MISGLETGLALAAYDEASATSSVTEAVFSLGDATQEQALIDWLAAVPDGQVVSGSYSVALPDGRIQHVKYTADHYNGYVAEVTYEGQYQYLTFV